MFKCIKEVVLSNGNVCFKKGETYYSNNSKVATGHETRDETGNTHVIGREGDAWFDEHFRELTDEEYYNFMVESYSDMPNHDEIETKALQESIKKQIEDAVSPYKAFYDYYSSLYGQGLEVSNWHQNGNLESFDNFFEEAEQEMKDVTMTIERKKEDS